MPNAIKIIRCCCYLHLLERSVLPHSSLLPMLVVVCMFSLSFSGGKGIEEVCACSSHHFIWHCSFLKKVEGKIKIGVSYEGYGWEIKNVRADSHSVACEDGKLIPSPVLLVLKLSLEKDSHETCSGPSTPSYPKGQISWRTEGLLDERILHPEKLWNSSLSPPSAPPFFLSRFLNTVSVSGDIMVPFIDHEKLKWKQPLLLGCRTEEEAINEIEGRKSRKWHMNVGKHTSQW